MKVNKDICPMTGLKVNLPCTVFSCPSNAIHHKSGVSCVLLQTSGLSIKALAEVLNEDSSRLKRIIEKQVKVLSTMMNEIKILIEQPVSNSCLNCGYIRQCQSKTLCSDRREAIDFAMTKLRNGNSINDEFVLDKTRLWLSVVQGNLSFIPEQIVKPLKELLSSKDAKGKRHERRYK